MIISFKRFVDGVEGEAFYQKRAPENRPAWLRTVTLSFPSDRKAEDFNPDYFAAKLPDRSPPDGDYRSDPPRLAVVPGKSQHRYHSTS